MAWDYQEVLMYALHPLGYRAYRLVSLVGVHFRRTRVWASVLVVLYGLHLRRHHFLLVIDLTSSWSQRYPISGLIFSFIYFFHLESAQEARGGFHSVL